MKTEEKEQSIRLLWQEETSAPCPANQAAVNPWNLGEVVIKFGYAELPTIQGTEEEQKKQYNRLSTTGIPIITTAKVVLSTQTAKGLKKILNSIPELKGEESNEQTSN